MRLSSATSRDGIICHALHMEPGITGMIWYGESPVGPSPVLLLAHGGGQHAQAPGIEGRAARYAAHGYLAIALDAPGHGNRPKTAQDEQLADALRAARGEPDQFMRAVTALNASVTSRAVPEWLAVLDAVVASDLPTSNDSVGFFGLSLGAAIGLSLTAVEPRIRAANLGLLGDAPVGLAVQVRIPVEFLVQWDDELVPRDSALRLFDAIGSPEKTLHANPGPHIGVPAFELDSSVRFFDRHLMNRAR